MAKGRQEGAIGKDRRELLNRLEELGCDPVKVTAQICIDNLPCTKCHPSTHKVTYTQYLIWTKCPDPEVVRGAKSIREKFVCPWCAGTGRTILTNAEVLTAARELLSRMHAKLASKKVEKQVRRVRLSRMNAVSDERREELERIVEKAEKDSSIH